MAPQPTLRERILDKLAEKDFTPEALAKSADISLALLKCIIENEREQAPAFPYVRIQLLALAEALNLDPQEVTSAYKREFSHRVSGLHDRLPANRYALPRRRRPLFIGSIAGGLILLFLLFWGRSIFSDPLLIVTNPPAEPQPFIVSSSNITLRGQIDPNDKLMINNQIVPVQPDGTFAKPYTLDPELNFIEFRVERLLGGDIHFIREVFYDPTLEPLEDPVDSSDSSFDLESSTTTEPVL